MLHHGQQLDVREAEVLDVVDEVLGEVDVAQTLPPRAQVDLVGAHRPVVRIVGRPVGPPLAVAPLVARLVDDGRLLRRDLGALGHRVGVDDDVALLAADRELVVHPGNRTGDEQLPDAALAEAAHRVGDAVPAVEVADDVDRLGPRRPDGEGDSLHLTERAAVAADVRAEDGPEPFVATLVEQVQVHLTERGGEPVGVVLLVLHAVVPRDEEPVVRGRRDVRCGAGPHAVANVPEVHDDAVGQPRPDRLGERPVCGDGQPARAEVVSQEVVRLAVLPLHEGLERPEVAELCGGGDGLHEGPFRATTP